MAEDHTSVTTPTVSAATESPAASQHLSPGDAGLTSPDSNSRAESFVSAPSTPHDTQGSTPATTISTTNDRKEENAQLLEIPANGPLKTPLSLPLPESIPKKRAPLTAEQQSKYDAVLAVVSEWTTIPASTHKNAVAEPIQDRERMWLTKECLQRYLRATKWNVDQAIQRLQTSLAWRKEYGADGFTAEYISPENETGKQCLVGFDIEGRPVWYMTPSRQNTALTDRQIHQVSYMLDRAVELMPPGQETVCILVSFKNSPRSNVPSLDLGRQALNVLQNHNPERLGRCLLMDIPWFFTIFLKLITPFIDPATKEKLVFDPKVSQYIPQAQLIDWYKGDVNFDYDHSVYWPALAKEAERRSTAYKKRWIEGGEMIGENEEYLRGGDCKSIREERGLAAASTTSAVEALPAQIDKIDISK